MDKIKVKKEIVREVAEELGVNEKVVSNIVDSSIEFFHHQIATNEELLTFGFRNLCTFNANFRMMQQQKKNSEIVKKRYDRLNELEATSRHVDLPLAWVLFRNHSKYELKEGETWWLPRLYRSFTSYYNWLKIAERINNKKVEKYFK